LNKTNPIAAYRTTTSFLLIFKNTWYNFIASHVYSHSSVSNEFLMQAIIRTIATMILLTTAISLLGWNTAYKKCMAQNMTGTQGPESSLVLLLWTS
jgi:hypothetical protein